MSLPHPPEPVAELSCPALRLTLRRLYLLALGALALPGLLLGVPLGLWRPAQWTGTVLGGTLAAALLCGLLCLYFVRRTLQTEPAQRGVLAAASQLGALPGVPLLLACTALSDLRALACLLGLAAVLGLAGWLSLDRWAHARGRPQQAGMLTG
jgi:hypothetical protein